MDCPLYHHKKIKVPSSILIVWHWSPFNSIFLPATSLWLASGHVENFDLVPILRNEYIYSNCHQGPLAYITLCNLHLFETAS